MRDDWAGLSDAQLLAQCEVDTYRASGPGGQKRNKTSSAVRLRHTPSGLIVIAEESRSQHENKAKALRRLRQAFYLKIREPLGDEASERPEVLTCRDGSGRWGVGRRDPRYWPAIGLALDVLNATEAQVSTAAERLGITTANLIDFLGLDAKAWEQANVLRHKFRQKPLRPRV
jgi:hypothetical protein